MRLLALGQNVLSIALKNETSSKNLGREGKDTKRKGGGEEEMGVEEKFPRGRTCRRREKEKNQFLPGKIDHMNTRKKRGDLKKKGKVYVKKRCENSMAERKRKMIGDPPYHRKRGGSQKRKGRDYVR